MTLTTRLTLFFLAMLGLVLVGFSASLYLLARTHLYRQADERLEAALDTLTAAAEIGPEGVEWEPAERQLKIGPGAFGEPLVWLVSDPAGNVVDRAASPDAVDFLGKAAEHLRTSGEPAKRLTWQDERWQFRQRRLEATTQETFAETKANKADHRFPQLSIIVGTPREPVRATLRQLAGVLIGLSLGVWLLALLASRAVCRRALLPVTRMATAAHGMNADNLDQRLPASKTGDQLEELSRGFNGLLDRLQVSFERQARFTGEASHQLRTPLTAMLGQIEVALRRERSPEEYAKAMASVKQQAERLQRIVESLLFLARADAEAELPDRERVDLREWLREYVRSWTDHPRANDINLKAEDSKPAWVQVQSVLLGELVNILVDNACKYSPSGTPITIRLSQAAAFVELSVLDEGTGIGAEDVPHLFTPFFRSQEARRSGAGGVGLGLAIAKRLANAFDATLSVETGGGKGSCFTVRLHEDGVATKGFAVNPAG